MLRTYEASGYNWTGSDVEDRVYRDGLLLAAELPNTGAIHHFHLDHLGTPRLITDQNRAQVAYHVYYPFGEEATPFNQDAERMKFTGHERDLASAAGAGDDLDYMHERFFNPLNSRFETLDPVLGDPTLPQSWNRFSYVLNNPLELIDPSGMSASPPPIGDSPVADYIYAEGIFAYASPWRGTTNDPNTGLAGLASLIAARRPTGAPDRDFDPNQRLGGFLGAERCRCLDRDLRLMQMA